jgi:predicted phage baseplate assembly protein
MALLELFAWVGDLNNYYIDRIANEAFLPTAQLRSSVLNLAYLLDYEPASAQPAVAVMSLTQRVGAPASVLPAGTQFATPAQSVLPGVIFETPIDYHLPANTTANPITLTTANDGSGNTVPITVVQGVTVTGEALGTSSGLPNQILPLFNPNVIDGTVQVFVDEGTGAKQWAFFGDLVDASAATSAFSVSMDANGVFYVLFGDGVNGRVPANGAHISATYRTCVGSAGNVGAGTITVDRSLTTLFSAVTNSTPAAGGADAETNDQIRTNAPKSLTALGRCVSLQDYASVALGFPSVSKAAATSSVTSSVLLYVHPAGGPYDSNTLQSLVVDPLVGLGVKLTNAAGTGYLDSRKPAGTSVTVLPPTYNGAPGYLPVVLSINVNVKPQYSDAQVQQDVTTALDALFDFGAMTFGALITQSAVYHACMAVAGVDYVTISEMRRADQPHGTINNIQAGAFELISLMAPSSIIVNPTGGL